MLENDDFSMQSHLLLWCIYTPPPKKILIGEPKNDLTTLQLAYHHVCQLHNDRSPITMANRNNVFAFSLRLEAFLIDNLDPNEDVQRTVCATFKRGRDELVVHYVKFDEDPVYVIRRVEFYCTDGDNVDDEDEEDAFESNQVSYDSLAVACRDLSHIKTYMPYGVGTPPLTYFDSVSVSCNREAFTCTEADAVERFVREYMSS